MRLHVVALPHTQVTRNYSACAFTMKVLGFCRMMKARGHHVTLYAGEETDAPCDELVTCVRDAVRVQMLDGRHYTEANWEHPLWSAFNHNVATLMRPRLAGHDLICLIGGRAHKSIADAFPQNTAVEFGVGYGGTFAPFRVFESYAWMHTHYGAATGGDPCRADGKWFDAVIPGYLDPAEFPFQAEKDDYYLYVGRLIDRKGYAIAQDVCQRLGARLILAGPGEQKGYGEFVGVVGPVERGRLMAGAKALFAPTVYVEPFGNVAIEAMACGTPVIATDWGAFTETVVPGVTGYRCRTLSEFMVAAHEAQALDPEAIRQHVVDHYSLEVVGAQYETYFERLQTLWADGWYQIEEAA